MASLSRRAVGKALLALTLTGCGAAGAPPAAPTPLPPRRPSPGASKSREQTTISWSFWGDQKEIEINQRIVGAFQAVHPEIRIEARHEPWPTYFTRLQADWSRREAPDVMFLNNIPIYARTGALENLEPWIARDHYPIADFYPALLSAFRFGSNLHGLPRDNDTKVIYFNKGLFAEAGVALPSADWTWEEFRRTALKLTRRGADGAASQWGFAYEVNSWWRIWVWQNNGDILDDHFQPTRVRLDEPAAVEAIQFLADLTNVDGVTPPYDHLNGDAQRSLFREGKVAMILDNHSFVPSAAETPGLEWDVAPLPRGRRKANLAGGAGFAISAYSSKKEAAWTFFKFLQGAEGQALFAEAGVAVPARRSIREENIFQRRKPYNVAVFFEETEHGIDNYYFPKATEMDAYLDEALAPVFQGKEPAADAVRRSLPRLNALIAQPAG
jgi:multiple sugar transport system substrate-binding protein